MKISVFSCVHATRLYTPPCPSVDWSVGRPVTLYFFYDFYFWISLLLLKCSSDLKYGPCPPTCDIGSCVSGLVLYSNFFHFLMRHRISISGSVHLLVCWSIRWSVTPLLISKDEASSCPPGLVLFCFDLKILTGIQEISEILCSFVDELKII